MGYYDLTTPYMTQRYVFEHLGADSTLRSRIDMRAYEAGHQIYTSPACLAQLTKDIGRFVNAR
jgi:carboxypeptidase C (cathepsin A)